MADKKISEDVDATDLTGAVIPVVQGGVNKKAAPAIFPISDAVQTALNNKAASSHNHAASNITSGTLAGARLPDMSSGNKGAVPATGTPSGKYLKDNNTWDNIQPMILTRSFLKC